MADLISRAAAIAEIEEYIDEYSELDLETGYHNLKWCAMEEAKDVLLTLPAVDAAPVVHGRWLVKCKAVDGSLSECSVCHDWQVHNGDYIPKYCPECGAKMDGDGDPDGLSVAARDPLSESGREMPKCEVTKDG